MDHLPFLDQTIKFSDGTSFERLDPITDFRQCHGVVPPERRILYRCQRLSSPQSATGQRDEQYILKVKVQIPDSSDTKLPEASEASHPSHSDATAHELSALEIFQDAGTEYGPRLVAFDTLRQNPDGLLPGGYISCTIMNVIPGKSLFDLGYWSLEPEDREEIQKAFLNALA